MQKQAFWWISSCLPPKVCNPICPTKLLQSIWLDNSNPWSDMILFHCSEMISYHFMGIIFSQALSRWYPHIICNDMKYFTSAQGSPQSICYSNRTPWLLKLHDCRNSMKKMKENKFIKIYLLLINTGMVSIEPAACLTSAKPLIIIFWACRQACYLASLLRSIWLYLVLTLWPVWHIDDTAERNRC